MSSDFVLAQLNEAMSGGEPGDAAADDDDAAS